MKRKKAEQLKQHQAEVDELKKKNKLLEEEIAQSQLSPSKTDVDSLFEDVYNATLDFDTDVHEEDQSFFEIFKVSSNPLKRSEKPDVPNNIPSGIQSLTDIKKFKFNKMDQPKKFESLTVWKRKRNKTKSVTDNCIFCRYAIKFELSYAEVYGRLLGESLIQKDMVNGTMFWLNDSLIDSSIKVMIWHASKQFSDYMRKSENAGKDIPSDVFVPVTFVATTYFHRYFCMEKIKLSDAKLCFYGQPRNARSMVPLHFSSYELFLIPWNISNLHWVLLYVHFDDKEIAIIDSQDGVYVSKDIVERMQYVLKTLCALHNYEQQEKRKNEENNINVEGVQTEDSYVYMEEFRWIKVNSRFIPQQQNNHDCGVFMLMMIYVLLNNKGERYTQESASLFRQFLFESFKNMMYIDENMEKEIDQKNDDETLSDNSNFEKEMENIDNDIANPNMDIVADLNSPLEQVIDDIDRLCLDKASSDEYKVMYKNEYVNQLRGESKKKSNSEEKEEEENESDMIESGNKNKRKRNKGKNKSKEKNSKSKEVSSNDGPDYTSLKRKLEINTTQRQTKYIMAMRVKGKWKYYVSISNDRHPRTSPGGMIFFELTKEYVSVVLSHVKSLQSLVEQIRREPDTWIEMNDAFKKQFHEKDLVYDRETIIRNICSYQRLVVLHPNDVQREKFFGIIVIEGEPAITDELTFEDIKSRRLNPEVASLRASGKSNSWVTLTHGSAKESVSMKYSIFWPRTTFLQGNYNACMLRSMQSVLKHLLTKTDRTYHSVMVFNGLITHLSTMAKECRHDTQNELMTTVNEKLRKDGFQIKKFKKIKRKRSGIYVSYNILDSNFDFGLFSLVQLCGNDMDINHSVVIIKDWIFDSNHERALPLCQSSLNICCSTRTTEVVFEEATLIYRYKFNK